MPRGRVRTTLVVAVVLAVLASVLAVVEWRQRVVADNRMERLAGSPAGTTPPESSATTTGDGTGGGDGGGGDNLFSALLEALGGGGGDSVAGVTGALLEDCASVLGSAAPQGLPGLFADREERSADAGEQLRRIAAAVEELRGLRFRRVPDPAYLPPDELARRVQAQVSEERSSEATAAEARALIAVGALPPDADLAALTLRALGEQVAGYYDPATGELVVGRSGSSGRLDGQSRIVLAHELDHALVDQTLRLPVDDSEPPPGTEDAALARLALVEGDATLIMQLYGVAHVALLEQLGGLGGALASQDQLARLPYHLQRSLTSPYLDGLSFVCGLHRTGGWPAVDRAYRAPPTTTAQVLFPERYRAGEAAVDPRDPTAPGDGWKAAPRRALGAAELQWLLEAPGGDRGEALDRPADRAAAWSGGELQVWTDGARTAAGVVLVQRAGERPMCATMVAWYTAAFPGGRGAEKAPGEELAVDGARQDAVVRCAGVDVRIGIAPDLATARAITR